MKIIYDFTVSRSTCHSLNTLTRNLAVRVTIFLETLIRSVGGTGGLKIVTTLPLTLASVVDNIAMNSKHVRLY